MIKTERIKIALVNPPYDDNCLIFFSIPYLVNGLRKNLPEIHFKIFDCPAQQYSVAELFAGMEAYQPDIIGVSIPFSLTLKPALEIIRRCRDLFTDAWIVSGGAHATLCPEDLVGECDYVVMGEGEDPLTRIIQAFQHRKKSRNIPGIAYSTGDGVVKNPRQKLASVVMGSPDWSDYDLTPFLSPCIYGSSKKGFTIYTSKGCPYNCSYCSNHLLWNKKIIYRDLDEVFAEIQYLQQTYNIEQFAIGDDLFTIDRANVIDFCEMVEKKQLGLEWTFQTRANLVKDRDMLVRMRKAGAKAVSIGIESGNADVLQTNKKISLETIVNAVKMIKSAGLLVYSGFIIGFPEDTIDTVWDTIRFPDELDIDSPGFQLMVPYPKTRVRDKALKEGGILTNDFSKYTTYGVVYVPPGLKGYDLLAIRKFAFQYFHTRTEKRLGCFLRRFQDSPDYDQVKTKFEGIYAKRDSYTIEHLKTLKYSADTARDQKIAPLPI